MKKKIANAVFIIVIIVICIFICIKNRSNINFYDTNILQLLTFALTACISFFFVQYLTDKRRKIDCIDHVISDIENMINNDNDLFSINNETLLKQEAIANRIKYISENGFKEIESDIDYIENEFNELRELYGNHNSSEENLSSIKADLMRHKSHISSRCVKVHLKLFNI